MTPLLTRSFRAVGGTGAQIRDITSDNRNSGNRCGPDYTGEAASASGRAAGRAAIRQKRWRAVPQIYGLIPFRNIESSFAVRPCSPCVDKDGCNAWFLALEYLETS